MTTHDAPEPERSNPPGRSRIDYRLGTHARFLEAMLRRLPSQEVNDAGSTAFPLAQLLTEAAEDPAIALVDAWAVVEDILAFYQERLANEGFLRTAVERSSLRELAEMIGYRPAPGVAASVGLAFEVETAAGAPGRATVPAGTRALSLPDGGSLPQAFETSETVEVRAVWNAMRPRMSKPIDAYASELWFDGTNTQLQPGDWVIVERKGVAPSTRRVTTVTPLQDERRTRVELASPAAKGPPPGVVKTYFSLESLGEVKTFDPPLAVIGEKPLPEVTGMKVSSTWLAAYREQNGQDLVESNHHLAAREDAPIRVKVLREHVGFFGHNAAAYPTLASQMRMTFPKTWEGSSIWSTGRNPEHRNDSSVLFLEREVRSLSAGQYLVVSSPSKLPELIRASSEDVHSKDQYMGPFATGPTLYKITDVRSTTRTDYGVTAKTSRVVVTRVETEGAKDPHPVNAPRFYFREAMASLGERTLDLVGQKDTTPLRAGDTAIELDGYVPDLFVGQRLMLSGERMDLPGVTSVEEHAIDDIEHELSPGRVWTTIRLVAQLAHPYVRETVRINGNVVPATHGETHIEVIGSGDAAVPNQRFRLQRAPLTHVPSTTGRGSRSTLEIWVGGVQWTQVDSLFELGPDDRSFVVDLDDAGITHVVFGDGINGALLPTGLENVEARYRFGLGLAGHVGAGKIVLLQARPLGVRAVTNPRPADDAEDPEPRDRIRRNAPLTVRTFDRVVSATDYEDFAEAFAGVGKARATRLWRGDREIVHLTVAAADGSPASPTLRARLAEAIRSHADPSQRFQIDAHVPVSFSLEVAVQVEPTHESADVIARVRQHLTQAYGFASRAIAQSVSHAEVMTLVQRTPGVAACRIEALRLTVGTQKLQAGARRAVLRARPARTIEHDGIPEIHAADLLLLGAGALKIVEEQR